MKMDERQIIENEEMEENTKSHKGVKTFCAALAITVALGTGGIIAKKALSSKKDVTPAVTTEAQATEEAVVEGTTEEVVVDTNTEIENAVEESYEKYSDFYESLQLNKETLRNVALVANNEYQDLTKEELDNAGKAINLMLMSDNFLLKVQSLSNDKVDQKVELFESPSISDLIVDKESNILPIIERIEKDRDLIANSLDSKSSFKEARKEFNKDVIDMFNDTLESDNGKDVSDFDATSSLYIVSVAKESVLGIAQVINPGKDSIKNKDGEVKIAFNDNEREIENLYYQESALGEVTDKTADAYAKIVSKLKVTEYHTKSCDYFHQMTENLTKENVKTLTK